MDNILRNPLGVHLFRTGIPVMAAQILQVVMVNHLPVILQRVVNQAILRHNNSIRQIIRLINRFLTDRLQPFQLVYLANQHLQPVLLQPKQVALLLTQISLVQLPDKPLPQAQAQLFPHLVLRTLFCHLLLPRAMLHQHQVHLRKHTLHHHLLLGSIRRRVVTHSHRRQDHKHLVHRKLMRRLHHLLNINNLREAIPKLRAPKVKAPHQVLLLFILHMDTINRVILPYLLLKGSMDKQHKAINISVHLIAKCHLQGHKVHPHKVPTATVMDNRPSKAIELIVCLLN